jgi:hypothetical protein
VPPLKNWGPDLLTARSIIDRRFHFEKMSSNALPETSEDLHALFRPGYVKHVGCYTYCGICDSGVTMFFVKWNGGWVPSCGTCYRKYSKSVHDIDPNARWIFFCDGEELIMDPYLEKTDP